MSASLSPRHLPVAPRAGDAQDPVVIEVRGLRRSFAVERGRDRIVTRALGPLSLTIPDLQFVALVGRSGSGKTTLLRLIAGLLDPTEGEVAVDGRPIAGPGPDRAVVFQQSALYPWRTVQRNLMLPLEIMGLARDERAARAKKYLALVGLRRAEPDRRGAARPAQDRGRQRTGGRDPRDR